MPSSKLPIAEFTKAIRKKSGSSQKLMAMSGYLGESDMDGNVRLYRSESMQTHVELPEEAIVHHEKVAGSELGKVIVWVDLEHKAPEMAEKPRKLADIFDGAVVRDLAGVASRAAGVGGHTPIMTGTTPRNCPIATDYGVTPVATGTTPRNCPVATDYGIEAATTPRNCPDGDLGQTPVLTVTTPRACPEGYGGYTPRALSIAVCSLNECSDVACADLGGRFGGGERALSIVVCSLNECSDVC